MDDRDRAALRTPHYLVTGGVPLQGEVVVSGAKNAVTKMVIASLLTTEPCVLRNVPLLGDLDLTTRLCQDMGSQVQLVDHILSLHTPYIDKTIVSTEVGGLNRIAVLTLGPLLHRCGEASIPKPGGDRIGPRPIDYHIEGLRKMGATIVERDGYYHCSIAKRLQGVTIKLPFPSVMATENFLISASLAKGVTIIENAALEPEIVDLIKFLQKMGAIIEIKVDRRIVIDGVDKLHGASHTLLSDRNEAVSLAVATYLTKGDVYLRGAQPLWCCSLRWKVCRWCMRRSMRIVLAIPVLCKVWARTLVSIPSAWARYLAASARSNTCTVVSCVVRLRSKVRISTSLIYALVALIFSLLYVQKEPLKSMV